MNSSLQPRRRPNLVLETHTLLLDSELDSEPDSSSGEDTKKRHDFATPAQTDYGYQKRTPRTSNPPYPYSAMSTSRVSCLATPVSR